MGAEAAADKKLNSCLPYLVGFLCVIQPILDVIAYWNQQFGMSNTWTTVLRLVLLLGGFVVGFLVSRRRGIYLVFSLVLLLFLGGHAAACLMTKQGYLNWTEDLIDQGRTLVLPVTALTFMSFLQADRRVLPALLRSLIVNLCLILLVMLLSTLMRNDPHTYPSKALGVRGWFIWPSPQSAILSILSPLTVAWALHRWPERALPVALVSLISFGMLFFYGTRLSWLTIVGVGASLSAVVFFFGGRLRRRQAAGILLCALIFTALYPVSPMAKNRAAVAENEQAKKERVSAAAAEAAASSGAPAETGPNGENMEAIRAAYRYNLQGMIDRFGLERTARQYRYTLDAGRICNDRLMKVSFCRMLMDDVAAESPLSRFFGLELERTHVRDTEVYDFYTDDWNVDTENYDPENDVIGVLTLNGIVGLALLAGLILWVCVLAIVSVWKDRRRFTPLFASFAAACGIALIYACSTASTLRRNNASVYFAWALAGLWYLSTRSLSEGGPDEGR